MSISKKLGHGGFQAQILALVPSFYKELGERLKLTKQNFYKDFSGAEVLKYFMSEQR